jgi:tellurite resistance protein
MKKKTEKKECSCACGCQQETLLSPADAVMAVAILAVSSDGKLKDKEINNIKGVLASSPLFDKVKDAGDYMGCIASAIADKGRAAVLERAAELLTPSLRETAYAWAVYMVASDRKVVGPEHKFLGTLRKALGLHGVLAGKINAVVPMLNRVK